MSSMKFDSKLFQQRLTNLYNQWNDENSQNLKSVDGFIITCGSFETAYSKTQTLQCWLLGYELRNTLMLFTKNDLIIQLSKKKLEFLSDIDGKSYDGVKVKLILKPNDFDPSMLEPFYIAISNSGKGKTLGYFMKDHPDLEFYVKTLAAFKSKYELKDISEPISKIWSFKDSTEIENFVNSANVTVTLYNKFIRHNLFQIISADKKYKHSKFSSDIAEAIHNKAYLGGLQDDMLDVCYDPIVMSGSEIVLKLSHPVSSNRINFGTIITSHGLRYKSYCTNCIRTLLVNPPQAQTEAYDYCLSLIEWVIERIKPGLVLSDLHSQIMSKIKEERPAYYGKVTKTFGGIMGIEFKEAASTISAKSQTALTANNVLSLNIGFQDVDYTGDKSKEVNKFSVWIGETILIDSEGKVKNLTENAKRKTSSIKIVIQDEESEESEVETPEKKRRGGSGGNLNNVIEKGHRRAILDQKTRNEVTAEEKRSEHRKDLFKNLLEDSKNRLSGLKSEGETSQKVCSNVAYKGIGQMPKSDDIRKLNVFVDKKYESIIVPIFGLPTPFHISSIKNVSLSVEGQCTYLRINFHYPRAIIGNKDASNVANPQATHVKELTLRANNEKKPGEIAVPATNLHNAHRLIKEVQKRFRSREAEERERADLVEQDELVVNQNKGAFRLKDLYVRPSIVQRRITGTLEAHSNGFRYISSSGDRIDILYNNIKHAFYQPCDGEMIILLHFHLKNAIMYAKKKQTDIQYYAEVGELTTDLGKAHSRMRDRDDLESEQQERELREDIKRIFRTFVERAENLARRYKLEFESPFKDLGFYGCPHRSTVQLLPTSSCLVSLVEFPPVVVTLSDVEFVMFERVSLSIRTFDMVIVFKDYSKKVLNVNSIPCQSLDLIKEWLMSCDLYYAEGSKSINWVKLMKTITNDPTGFIEEGGWEFLSPQDEVGEEDEVESELEDENYAPTDLSGDESESGSDYENSSEEESEDWDAEDDESSEELDSDESEGLEWDELERRAALEDKKVEMGVEDITHKRKRSPSPIKKSHKRKR